MLRNTHSDECTWKSYKVKVIRKAFSRNIRLRVLPSLVVEIRVSKSTSQRKALQLLEENQAWIEKAYARMHAYAAKCPRYSFVDGQSFMYLGQEVKLKFWDAVYTYIEGDQIMCPQSLQGDEKKIREALRACFKRRAEDVVILRAYRIAEHMGIHPTQIRIADYRSRWGSCNYQGRVSLSWRLVACPIEIIDYVIVHEYCHLVHMNHSKDFWNLVEAYCPDRKVRTKWLRENAMKLDFLEKKSQLYS